VGKCAFRLAAQPVYQGPQNTDAQDFKLIGIGRVPSFEFRATGEIEVLKETAAKCRSSSFESGNIGCFDRTGFQLGDPAQIQIDIVRPDEDSVLFRFSAVLAFRIDDLADFGKAPPQGAPRIVRYLPEQVTQAFPPETTR
jgi:hypothetical protein